MEKPKVKLIRQDSNIFSLLGICTKALKRNNQHDKAKELTEKVFASNSYNEALSHCMDYVEVK